MTRQERQAQALAYFASSLNLDCEVGTERLELLANAPSKTIATALGCSRDDAMALADYASRKVEAMRSRVAGDISMAMGHERACERIYAQLSESVRW